MSTLKLNLIDSQSILSGEIHGSVADSCIAALSAEPETISELEAALARYIRPVDEPFAYLANCVEVDSEPVDAGIVVIDLAARVIACDSSYSAPSYEGSVQYHDGTASTDVLIPFRLPDDWLFVNSVEAFRWSSERRRMARQSNPPIDARAILYGSPLHSFIKDATDSSLRQVERANESLIRTAIVGVHRDWLMTPRADLRSKTPRQVLLEKQDFIDFDLHTRCLQWSELNEGPPCLPRNSFAYRYAGFGTHEWVIYYYLVRHLLGCLAFGTESLPYRWEDMEASEVTSVIPTELIGRPVSDLGIDSLERIQSIWLEFPDPEYYGKSPANIIENERRRLPEVMKAKDLIIDEDCECCRMMALDAELGLGPTFWHLDGCNMEDEFAFSSYVTIEEWEAERRRYEVFDAKLRRDSGTIH